MLDLPRISVHLNTDFLEHQAQYLHDYDVVIYTGMIDELLKYQFGELAYRSLEFKTEIIDTPNYQGNAVINYTDAETPFTRIIEHKWFEFGTGNKKQTVITHEYPKTWQRGVEPFYPINNRANNHLFTQYREYAAEAFPQIVFGGRLGMYRYYNMDQVIAAALQFVATSPLFN